MPSTQTVLVDGDANFNSDAPRKKRKYIPGGPGGGGHWVEVDMTPDEMVAAAAREARLARRRRSAWKQRGRPSGGQSAPRPRRTPRPDKPTFDSAADAVALVDGYKPREERSWEEFHPDLDLEAKIKIYTADEVDGSLPNGDRAIDAGADHGHTMPPFPMLLPAVVSPPVKRKPGRPPGRRAQAEKMLNGLGIFTPPRTRPVPLPIQNPRERLNLPKPSYRLVPSLDSFEQDKAVRQNNFVTKTMESLGYQKTDRFSRQSEREMIRLEQSSKDEELEPLTLAVDTSTKKTTGVRPTAQVEYDMDEQDEQWLDDLNKHRRDEDKVEAILPAVFEVTMTQIEKEWHAIEKRIPKPNPKPPQTQRPRSGSSAAVNGETPGQGEEQDSKCAVCDDGDCENTNAIVFCDGCDLAVHQECYGVPYIPEGQWLCRKCQQVGKALPTCIFCPNTDGAFKMTTESKWAHLVCSIWIPEVTIGNASFMEPIMGVGEVQRARWKLNCYICNQKMGACIQCANRNCYQAFHVTCARKAKLFLKMKSPQGGPAALDSSSLKAYCDKHVPSDWRNDHDVDGAMLAAKTFYRREMRGRRWADSQESALSFIPSQQNLPVESIEEMKHQDELQGVNATPGQKKKRLELQKKIWRLPSGAPIVPQVIFNAVENALQKFNPLPRRKDFVAEACKYWSLKREARRGASLLKRLQLQMETFTTTEISRRDFAAMGPAGGPRLQRRIDFAKQLEKEMSLVQQLCNELRNREAIKLQDAESLAALVDTVYFPITNLVRPVLDRAKRLDEKTLYFGSGLAEMQRKVDCRAYTSVAAFSADLTSVLQHTPSTSDEDGTPEHAKHVQEVSKVAKRILHQTNAGGMLREAMQNEAELVRQSHESAGDDIEAMISAALSARSEVAAIEEEIVVPGGDEDSMDKHEDDDQGSPRKTEHHQMPDSEHARVGDTNDSAAINDHRNDQTNDIKLEQRSTMDRETTHGQTHHSSYRHLGPLQNGGIPWYFERFDPDGTTFHDERWDGAERAMSAELSEMGEEELTELGIDMSTADDGVAPVKAKKAGARKRRRNW